MKKIHHQLLNSQSIFKKTPTVGLQEVSRLINLAIKKRQGDQRKHSFLEKKNTAQNGKWIHYEHPEVSHHLVDRALKQSTRQFYKILFHISKCLACSAEKTLQLKTTRK